MGHDFKGTARVANVARTSLDEATAWIERQVHALDGETVALADAVGHVSATEVVATAAVPAVDCVAVDGLAVRADQTIGASAYNPLTLRVVGADSALAAMTAVRVAAGAPLPTGATAVIANDQVQRDGDHVEVVDPVGDGHQVARAGSHIAPGARLLAHHQRIDGHAIGALAAAGIATLAVVAAPRVRVVMVGRDRADTNSEMLTALLGRDGGRIESVRTTGRDRATIAAALADRGADLVLIVGGSGPGDDDHAAAALADAGELAIHGVGVRQCATAGLGMVPRSVPVILLPGASASCLWAYELLGGPAVRRRGGRSVALPFPVRRMTTARKIVSAIGLVDICPVACRGDDQVEPTVSFDEAGIGALLRADGVVIVPAGSEGHARASEVVVYLLRP